MSNTIENFQDVYKLIKSSAYTVAYVPQETKLAYNIYNSKHSFDRIHIDIYSNYMEIYKYNRAGSEYYENISTTNKKGRKILFRFNKLLSSKTVNAVVADTKQNCK